MPKYRKFYVKSTESWDINDMPDDFTRLLWVMLPLGLCREGRGVDNPAWIKSKIFPLRLDVTAEMINAAMAWYVDRGMVERYEIGRRKFFYIPTWHDYQGNTIKEADSIYPAPPQEEQQEQSGASPELVGSKSGTDSVFSTQYTDAHVDSNSQSPTPSGENSTAPQNEPEPEIEWNTPAQSQPRTKEKHLQSLRDAAGADVLEGAALAMKNASDHPMSLPPQAGGADPWDRVADAFCCLHGLRLSDIDPGNQTSWPREMERIATKARASPDLMVQAIRALPESEYGFKTYSTPYTKSFHGDITMLAMQIAAGQDVRAKGNGHATSSRDNGSQPAAPGGDSVAEMQRKVAAVLGDRAPGGVC